MVHSGDIFVSCPIPLQNYPNVLMAHGGGGRLMQRLIEQVFLAAFGETDGCERHDSAILPLAPGTSRLAFTTDSYVVHPLFFPGGDIGSLAVHGTVNDLAMAGARPRWLSAGFIIEEGLPVETLWRVTVAMADAARKSGVRIVTGDTKVVERGKGDGLFINTAGIGTVEYHGTIGPGAVRPGDAVIVSGDIGRHGMAILSARAEIGFETALESDSAPVVEPVLEMCGAEIEIHCLRDLTRGGLSSALNEIAAAGGVEIVLDERSIPVQREVRAACELLGFDPLCVANEGRFVAFVPEHEEERALVILRRHAVSANAQIAGRVTGPKERGLVALRCRTGATRVVDMLSGEQLPRIC